jgi:hypothetical protein
VYCHQKRATCMIFGVRANFQKLIAEKGEAEVLY